MKLAIAAIVKDEIDSLAEWIAFHRVIGADHFLIADNGSNDGTKEYLESLSGGDWLQTVSVATPPDRAPQLVAYRELTALCPEDVDLIAFIDADEYILPVPAKGEEASDPRARMHAWLETRFGDPGVGAITLNWACFGSSGHRFKKEGLVIERFQKRAKQGFGPNHHYKSIVRRTALERMQNPHHPGLVAGDIRNAQGRSFEYRLSREGVPRRGLSEEIVWDEVRLNHYLVKSVEEFVLKKARRGSAATVGYIKTAVYFERHDKNDEKCGLAAALAPRVHEELRRLETIVEVDRRLAGREAPLEPKRDRPFFQRKAVEPVSPVRRFVVDYPQEAGAPRVEGGQTLVQGWLFLTDEFADLNPGARLVARWAPEFELKHSLSKKRVDVVAHFGYESPEDHPQRDCGFQFFLPLGVSRCELELELGQQRWPLQTLRIRAEAQAPQEAEKVLVGKDDWLFLRADTNLSFEQHCGKLLLTPDGLQKWKAYFHTLNAIAKAREAKCRLLITPSKETVLEEAYGTPRASYTAVDQILQLASIETIYPVKSLKTLGDESFYRTDTHWTHKAAMQTSVELAVSLGIDRESLEKLFEKDSYREIAHKGDLGGKLDPPVQRPVKILKSFSNSRLKVYDNAIPNFGRLAIFENERPLDESVLLLCGASSSAALFNYLSRIFARVIFVHTAGNLDPSLIDEFDPDVLVMQTTARFAIRPPTTDFSFEASLSQKIASLTPEDMVKIEKKRVVAESATNHPSWQRWEALYQRHAQGNQGEGDTP
ncbi:glycosyltransferase family 2 protein [Salinicola salarius]|uniref:glycosyltransferase family 2 protein n=1 Tax=Salinicola salarius TaxID=430457 RepID=UPI0023E4758E|nr:glycosyltransferase family 2 protein [Salinicola salarius]MDF3917774.1 glycosyltransferase family 2 protein [Salinicola salarius]